MGLFETIARGQKAIPAVPQLLDGEPMQIVSPGRTDTQGQISQRGAKRHFEAYGGPQAIDWVMDCIRIYSDATKDAGYYFERDGKRVEPTRTPSTPDGVEVLNDPTLNLLFTRPNPFMLWCDLLELAVVDLLLVGNAYWYKWRTTQEGKPLALYRLAPPYIKIVPGAFGVDKYEYQPPGAREPLELPADSVMHMKLPNPHSPYWGLGLIQGGGRAYDLELALTDSQAHFLENRGDPGIVLQSDRRVPRDVFNKLQMQLRARVNRKTSGELLLLESGLKAQSLSRHAQDALFPELTKMSRDRIMAMFRCSPRLLGIGDEASGADKDVDVRQEFDNYTLKPFLKRLAVNIGAGLLTPWGLEFRFDYQTILPHSVILENASAFAKTPGVKVKEIRKFLEPLGVFEDISTGDKTIDDYVLNMPGTNFDENGKPIAGDAAHADQPLAGEAGRPPLPQNTRPFPKGGAPLPKSATVRSPGGKALLDNLDQRLSKIQKPQRPQPVDQAARDDGVDAAAAAMIPGIKDAVYILERGLLDHSEGKAFEPKTLTSRVRKSEIWKTFMAALTTAIEQGSMRALSAASIHQAAEGRATDELDYETLAKELVFRHGGVRQITDNLKNEIVQKVSQAVAEGKTRDQVDGIIRESIDFWREHHAETVALTEAVHAYNEGTLAVAEASGFEHVFVEDGRDHDAPCLEADGQVWTIDHAREHRLEHPRCRRAFTPYTVPV
jgi:HK97 family phage portal protein